MAADSMTPINFTISAEAWSEIERIRAAYDRHYSEKADVLMIAWGTTTLDNGRSADGVVAGFYSSVERAFIEHGIQYLDNRELIFFVNSETMMHFEGKTISYTSDRGLYLS